MIDVENIEPAVGSFNNYSLGLVLAAWREHQERQEGKGFAFVLI